MGSLENLTFRGVDHTQHIIQHLSTLPLLKSYESINNLAPPHSRFIQGNRMEGQTGGFRMLETLNIRDAVDDLNKFFSAIGDTSPLRDLAIIDDWAEEKEGNSGIFPSHLLLRHLKNLSITFSYTPSQSLSANVLAAVGRFHSLASLRLRQCPLAITDEQLVAALRNCSNLEYLQLGDNVGVSGNNSRLSLGCLEPILSQCPLLYFIKGCFDLDQEKISTQPASPHPELNEIDLAGSYFVTPEPDWWISPTVGYLSSLAQILVTCISRMTCGLILEWMISREMPGKPSGYRVFASSNNV